MLDKIHLTVEGGRGGNGCESFYHRKDHKLVANGGDGGDGGNVIFRASHNAPGLDRLKLKQHLIAESGEHASSENKSGRSGEDLIVLVPLGTSLLNRESHLTVRDLCHEGEEVIVARGGQGGVGNIGGKQATYGKEGEKLEIDVEFRIMADVFLVGLPNSGKSSLLHRLTKANVEGKEYPFSTHSPVIGVYEYEDYKQISFCELPSLYEGSLEGKGLGMDFLKHLTRARYIIFMVDVHSKYAPGLRDGLAILKKIVYEKGAVPANIPTLVLINKADEVQEAEQPTEEIRNLSEPYFLISVKTGEGVESFLDFLKERLERTDHV